MKQIALSKGRFALVDDQDFEFLNQWKWYLSWNGYALRREYVDGKTAYIRMHRLINNTPEGMITDHINRNKLDNRRNNLRTVDKSINGLNTGLRSTNKSGYKGVYWESWSAKWRAEIKINYKKKTLGRYTSIKDAVNARKRAEVQYGV